MALNRLMAAGDDSSQLPLNGLVLCCTSIPPEQRSELAAIAAQMGAVSKLDLTSDVTHLVVGDADTPKYRYVAKERPDVKVLLPSWVQAVREKWISGTDQLDLASLEEEYRVPTFYNLRICVTGFEAVETRKEIEELAVENGASYKGDLTKEITHLIAWAAIGQKYTYAKQWGIKVVSLEWFQQSLDRGMILDESLFDPFLEPHERGRGARLQRSVSTSNLGKRRREDDGSLASAVAAQGRKLRRSASSKFDSQNEGFWTDIVSGMPAVVRPGTASKWEEDISVNETILEPIRPVSASSLMNPFEDTRKASVRQKALFSGTCFLIRGFDHRKTTILERHLSSHDATLLHCSETATNLPISDNTLILTPHTTQPSQIAESLRPWQNRLVTDFWLEKCLEVRTQVDANRYPVYRPFTHPVKGFESLVICSTGFIDFDLLHLGKTVSLVGSKYSEPLDKTVSVLLCKSSSMSAKMKGALERKIPAVNLDWLWSSIRNGALQDIKPYLIYPAAQQHLELALGDEKAQANKTVSRGREQVIEKAQIQESNEHAAQPRPQQSLQADSGLKTQTPSFEDDTPDYLPADEGDSNQFVEAHTGIEAKVDSKLSDVPLKPLPLQERSPNSPTKPTSPTKEVQDATSQQAQDRDELSETLHTLLAQQKSSGNQSSLQRTGSTGSARPGSVRRERKLLGRATSNLSTRSGTGAAIHPTLRTNISRASSIDTLHTDGLGTPIEGIPSAPLSASLRPGSSRGDRSLLTASALTSHDELLTADDDEQEQANQPPQMTQVGYEDPEAGRWRAKLLRKITAGKNGKSGGNGNVDEKAISQDDAPRIGLLEDEPMTAGAAAGAGRRSKRQRNNIA